MNIQKTGSVAILDDGGDAVCFHVTNPDPVFVPSAKRELLDRHLNGNDVSDDPYGQAFAAFLKAHGIVGDNAQPSSPESGDPCQACGGHEQKRSSASIYLLLAHGCNQACIYCLNGRDTYAVDGCAMMTDEIARKALRLVASSLTSEGQLEIVFFGGEPLLNWPLAKRIMRWASTEMSAEYPSMRLKYHLTTNLTLFPPDLLDYAKEFNLTFLVDVDGPPDIHDVTRPYKAGGSALADILRHVTRLRDADIPVALRATVTDYNDARMLEVTRFHRECGGSASAFSPLNAVDSDGTIMPRALCPDPARYREGLIEVYRSGIWAVEDIHPFNEYARRFQPGYRINHGCGAPYGSTPTVTADGKIFTCIYLVNNPQFEAGCVYGDDYPREDVLSWMRDVTDTNRRACRSCVFQYLCGGGCPVGLFGILRNPESADWAKQYTRDIACATSQAVLGELLFDVGRATTLDLESHPPPLREVSPNDAGLLSEGNAEQRISPEWLWNRIQEEAAHERKEEQPEPA
jgi:uncharacterized protein